MARIQFTLALSLLMLSTCAMGVGPDLVLGEPLANALAAYRPLGLNVISTSGLVSKRLRVGFRPDQNLSLTDQVQKLLSPHGLQLRHLEGDTWYVVRAEKIVDEPKAPSPLPNPSDFDPVIEEVLVTASYRLSATNETAHQLVAENLTAIPSAGGDTLRSLVSVPGVASSGVSASQHFRGGDNNEVLYLIDGVPLLEPFHLRDFNQIFTAINPNIVAAAEIFISGFPVEHGGKLSGVVALDLLQADAPFEGVVDINSLAASVHAAGTSDKLRWLVSGRQSTLETLFSNIETDYGEPGFHDELAQGVWSAEKFEVSVGFLNSSDEVELKDGDSDEEGSARFDYRMVWARAVFSLGSDWFAEAIFSALDARGKNSGVLDNSVDAVGILEAETEFDVMRIDNRWTWSPGGKHEFQFGWHAEHQNGDLSFEIESLYGPLALGIQDDPLISRDLSVDRDGLLFNSYVAMISDLSESVTMRFGLRYEIQDMDPVHEVQFSPRFQVSYAPNDKWQFIIDTGRYIQHQNLYELQIDDGLLEIQSPQAAEQISFTALRTWSNELKMRFDVYARHIDNPWRRFDNLYNPWVLLPELHADRYEVRPEQARMTGLEVSLNQSNDRGWSWSAAYVYNVAEERVDGNWHPKPWEQRHSLRVWLAINKQNWSASANFNYRTGWSTTDRLLNAGELRLALNEAKLPAFASFDIHLSRKWDLRGFTGEVYLDITNTLDRQNIGGYEYELEGINWERSPQRLLPIYPTLGFKFLW